MTVTMTEDQYWDVREALMAREQFEIMARARAASIQARLRAALINAGLEEGQSYRLDDETLTAERIEVSA